MTDVVEALTWALLGASGLLAVGRALKPGSIPDKLLGTDTFIVVIVAGVAVAAGITAEEAYLDILVVVTLLVFLGTITVARFVERRGARG
jgi:multicomponent Na+:H+ antiporter subunit F